MAETDRPELSEVEAMAGVAVCAVYADGVLTAEEDADLAVHVAKMRMFRRLGGKELDDLFRKMHRLALEAGDGEALVACAAALPARLRPTAYFLAADLVAGDDDLADSELRFLDRLRGLLGLDEATTGKILEVVRIKNAA